MKELTPLPDTAIELIENKLCVVSEKYKGWLDFSFLTFNRSDTDWSNIYCDVMMSGNGFLDLQECRHTYWGESGYMFYPDLENITTSLQWLKDQGFDMK